jgi:hypothetical protein
VLQGQGHGRGQSSGVSQPFTSRTGGVLGCVQNRRSVYEIETGPCRAHSCGPNDPPETCRPARARAMRRKPPQIRPCAFEAWRGRVRLFCQNLVSCQQVAFRAFMLPLQHQGVTQFELRDHGVRVRGRQLFNETRQGFARRLLGAGVVLSLRNTLDRVSGARRLPEGAGGLIPAD